MLLLGATAPMASAQDAASQKNGEPCGEESAAERERPEAPARRRILRQPVRRAPALRLLDPLRFPFTLLGKGLDAGSRKVENEHVLERAQDLQALPIAKGYEPLVGGLGTGSGFAFGVNVHRKNFLGSGLHLEVPLQYSTKGYAGLGVAFTKFLSSRERLYLRTSFEFQDRPEDDFFGLGPTSAEPNRTTFRLQRREVAVELGARLGERLRIGFPLTAANVGVAAGRGTRFPDLQQRFTESQVPGIFGSELVSFGAFFEWDYRNHPDLPTAGGRFYASTAYFQDTNRDDFRFLRWQAEFVQYLPLDDEHAVVLRALGIFNDRKGSARVPLSHKVFLGGRETLRGFRNFRFWDDQAVLFNAEYRWQVWKFADWVVFVDEGQVASELEKFSGAGFRHSHGVGIRFKSSRAQVFRVDVGHSVEGWRVYLSFRPIF